MLKWLGALALACSFPIVAAERPRLKIMVIFAHPDEGEIYAGGTTALYTKMGHSVKFLSLTNGDRGHYSMKPEDLARRRYQEAMESKRALGLSDYEVFDYHDQGLKNTAESRGRVIKSIQDFNPDVVFTFYPAIGGHTDNMTAGWIVREAAPALKMAKLPVFLYMRDFFTTGLSHVPHLAVAIDSVWETKLRGCGAHESQVVEYNPQLEGVLEEVKASKEKQAEFLFHNTFPYSQVTPDIMLALEKWYGKEAAGRVEYAEAFEIAEFGRQVNEAAIRELMPMLPIAITVPGQTRWLDTGIDVSTGQAIDVAAGGRIRWKNGDGGRCGPAGAAPYTRWGNKPMPAVSTGALIGKIGKDSTDYFFIGAGQKIVPFADGRLFVGINDDNVADNWGAFRMWVRPMERKQQEVRIP